MNGEIRIRREVLLARDKSADKRAKGEIRAGLQLVRETSPRRRLTMRLTLHYSFNIA